MKTFREWMAQRESSARTRAAMDPGLPARPDLMFAKPPYSQKNQCDKLKKTKTQNVDKSTVCPTKKKKRKKKSSGGGKKSR